MFLGHFAVALAAKRAAPRTSLGWLFAAAQLPDLIWPVLLLLGVERARVSPGDTAFTPLAFDHYPWSHSLLMVVVWAIVMALVYLMVPHRSRAAENAVTRERIARGACVLAVLVVSHWVLDWVTHRPDLRLVPGGSTRAGLGLWQSVVATMLVEGAMFVAGLWIYARTTSARDRVGRYGFAALMLLLAVIYFANAFGPPPPGITAVAVSALAMWLLVFWAAWADRHRTATTES